MLSRYMPWMVLGTLALAVSWPTGAAQPGEKRWEFQTGGEVHGSPAIGADGTLYVGSGDRKVYALNGATGQKRWEFQTGAEVYTAPAIGGDGTVYVGSDRFYALNGQTGTTIWELAAGEHVSASPAIGRNGTVYVGVWGTWPDPATLYALDGTTGAVLWKRAYGTADHPEWLVARVTIDRDGTVFAVAEQTGGGGFHWSALDPATGVTRRTLPWWMGGFSSCSPAFGTDDTTVGAKFPGSVCFAANSKTDVLRWETSAEGMGVLSVSPTIGADGSVHVGTSGGLWVLDLATGAQRWKFTPGLGVGETTSPALAADGTVYVGFSDMRLYALDGASGATRWEFVAGAGIQSSPAIGDDGTVYFGADDGKVYALYGESPLADAPWPMISRNRRHTGSAESDAPALPQITIQPAGMSVRAGSSFSLTVIATGNPFPTFLWYHAGQPVPGATGSTLQVSDAQLADAGDYHVTVSNSLGGVTSESARVVVGYGLDVSVRPSGSVRVEPATDVYEPGQIVQLTALPDDERQFLDWQGDAAGASNPLSLTMDGHKHIEARFSLLPGDVKWQFTTGGIISSGPAIGPDGTLYLGAGNRVYALDGTTGQPRWESQPGGTVSSSPALGMNGSLYVGSADGNIYALDRATGTKRWTFSTGSNVLSSPSVGAEGTVYVGSQDRKVYGLNGETGHKIWEFQTGGAVGSSPAVGTNGTVYVQSDDGKVYALMVGTGQKRWEVRIGDAVASPDWRPSPAIGADGTVFVESSDEFVHGLNGETGQRAWKVPTGGRCLDGSPVIGADGTVYVPALVPAGGPSYETRLYALVPATGQIRWVNGSEAQVDDRGPLSPAVGADGAVYVAASSIGGSWPDGFAIFHLYALDGATGRRIWYRSQERAWPTSSPAIGSDGTLYVGVGSQLYAFESASVGGLAQSSWPKFRGDAQNTGRASVPAPPRVSISRQQAMVRIEWAPPAILQSSDALAAAVWQDVSEAHSPFDLMPAGAHRFYRLRQP